MRQPQLEVQFHQARIARMDLFTSWYMAWSCFNFLTLEVFSLSLKRSSRSPLWTFTTHFLQQCSFSITINWASVKVLTFLTVLRWPIMRNKEAGSIKRVTRARVYQRMSEHGYFHERLVADPLDHWSWSIHIYLLPNNLTLELSGTQWLPNFDSTWGNFLCMTPWQWGWFTVCVHCLLLSLQLCGMTHSCCWFWAAAKWYVWLLWNPFVEIFFLGDILYAGLLFTITIFTSNHVLVNNILPLIFPCDSVNFILDHYFYSIVWGVQLVPD